MSSNGAAWSCCRLFLFLICVSTTIISGSSSNVLQQRVRNLQGLVGKRVDEIKTSLGQQHQDRMKYVTRIKKSTNGLSRRLQTGDANTETDEPPVTSDSAGGEGPFMDDLMGGDMEGPLCAALGPDNKLEQDWNLKCMLTIFPAIMGQTVSGDILASWCDDTDANSCFSEIDNMVTLARENGSGNCTELASNFEMMKTFCVKDSETDDYCWGDTRWPFADGGPITMAFSDDNLTAEDLAMFCSPCLFEMFNMIAETQMDGVDMDENSVFKTEADLVCSQEDGIYCMTLVDAFMEQPTSDSWCNACFTRTFLPMMEMDMSREEFEGIREAQESACQTDENGEACIDRIASVLFADDSSGDVCFGPLAATPDLEACPDGCETYLIDTRDDMGCCTLALVQLTDDDMDQDFAGFITDTCGLDIPPGCREEVTEKLEEEGEEEEGEEEEGKEDEGVSVNIEPQIMEAEDDDSAATLSAYVPITMVAVSVIICSLSI